MLDSMLMLPTFGLKSLRVEGGIMWDRPRANASAARPSLTFRCQSACITINKSIGATSDNAQWYMWSLMKCQASLFVQT
jgi:hypothetical protein